MKIAARNAWHYVGKAAFAAIFLIAGIAHFVSTDMFLKAMPPYVPWHRPIVLGSGGVEIALAILLLIPKTSRFAAWGLIALLVAVFPANIHIYRHQELCRFPPIVHLLRLPMQAVLILWAYRYTKPPRREVR